MSGTTIQGIGFVPTGTKTGSLTNAVSCDDASPASTTFRFKIAIGSITGSWAGALMTTQAFPILVYDDAASSLQPTPGSGLSSAARFTSHGPAWLSFGR
jgi:hypothetical protein